MRKNWNIVLLFCAAVLAVGCQAQPQQEELLKQPVDVDPVPEVVVQEEVEPKRLRDYIEFNSEDVVGVSVSYFSFGPSVVETETILPEYEASAFADKLGYFTTVVDFDVNKVGQGLGYTRYTLTMSDGSTVSFCEDGSSFFTCDSPDPIILGKDDSIEYICTFYEPYEPEIPPSCSITRYDYVDGVRKARTLDSYLNLRADEVVKLEREKYFAGDYLNSYILQIVTLENDDAKAAAKAMADTAMWTVDAQYEQMGLAESCRYTLTYADGGELSFCEDGIIFLSDSEFPNCNENGVEAICVLPQGTDFGYTIPEGTVQHFSVENGVKTPME